MGCDTQTKALTQVRALFQSAHPCGVRFGLSYLGRTYINFNPRTRVGCDDINCLQLMNLGISIRAPVWGAIHAVFASCSFFELFQSAHPCGVRLRKGVKRWRKVKFQSAHPCGVRCTRRTDAAWG